jgi:DNA-binding transcriptional regulator YdaS (Cro superfamily)
MQTKTAIQKAVTAAGGQTALAVAIGVTQGRVWQWLKGDGIPTRHFAAIERATGITAQDLFADEMAKSAKPAKTKAA